MGRVILITIALALLAATTLRAQQPAAADSGAGYYREYVNRLIEDWRLEQIRDFSQQWGMRVGGREFAVNRGFWEDRFNLSLAVGLPTGRLGQNLVMEYHMRPRFLVRGEVSHQPDRSEAWVDLIFRTEY